MHYNIVIVSNEGYIQHAAVMLTSLFCTNKDKHFVIWLLTDGITKETMSKLQTVCATHGAELKVITCGIDNLGDFPSGQWNPIMYSSC